MPNPPPELPDFLLRPVGENHELRHVFRGDLEERLANSDPARGEDTAADAAAWLGTSSSESPSRAERTDRVTKGIGHLALILLIAALSVALYEALPTIATSSSVPEWLRFAAARQIFSTRPELSPACIAIDGDSSASGAGLKGALRLWHAHPDDPVFFANYCRALRVMEHRLPEDYEETWRRIDPGNGYWPLLQAQTLPARTPSSELTKQMDQAVAIPRRDSYFKEILLYNAAAYRPPGHLMQTVMAEEIRAAGRELLEEELRGIQLEHGWKTPADTELGTWAQHETRAARDLAYATPHVGNIEELLFGGYLTALWRFGALVAACAFLVLGALLWLRLRPKRTPAGQFAACLSQLIRPWAVILPGIMAAVVSLGVSALAYRWTTPARDECAVSLASMPLTILITAIVMIDAARRQVSRRIAFLGLRSPRFQRVASPLMAGFSVLALGGMLVYIYALTLPGYPRGTAPLKTEVMVGILGGLGGLVVLWIAVTALLGYTSPTANLRHRLIARQMVPAALVVSALFSVLTIVSLPVEIAIVRHVMAGRGR